VKGRGVLRMVVVVIVGMPVIMSTSMPTGMVAGHHHRDADRQNSRSAL